MLHRFVIDGHGMGLKVCSTTQILITMEATKPRTAHPGFADDFYIPRQGNVKTAKSPSYPVCP